MPADPTLERFAKISALLAAIALFVALNARTRSSGLKERLVRLEAGIDELGNELRWLRVERRGEPPADDAPLFAPDSGMARTPAPKVQTPTPREPITQAPTQPAAARISAGSVPPVEPPSEPNFPPLGAEPPKSVRDEDEESFEHMLGTRWAVWAGGAALALGGLFLVKYSIEAGLLGPATRVVLGALLAAALLAAGEWMRRGDFTIPVEALPAAHIPSVLTAAGTVVAFGTIYAAHALYGFIGPTLAFLLLGATGVATMLASALHGPALAGLGLAASFVTPLLVSSDNPSPWPVVLFLAVVAGAAHALARTRHWLWLAAAAVAGAFVWGLFLISQNNGAAADGLTATATHTQVQLALATFFMALAAHSNVSDGEAEPDPVVSAALGALGLLAVFVIASHGFGLSGRTLFAAITIALLGATAWRSAPAAAAAAIGGIVALGVLLVWPGLNAPPNPNLVVPWSAGVLRLPDNVASFLTFGTLATLLPAGAMALRLWRGSLLQLPVAGFYALAATVPPLLALILAYLRITQFDISIPFALGAAALACVFGYAAERFHKADVAYTVPSYNLAAGAFAAAAIAALALALVFSLERGYLTVALALAALGAAYVASLRDIALLRYAVTALGLIVLARVLWDPRIMGASVGATPVFNWLLLGYGVPALAFAKAARWLESRADDLAVRLSDSLAALFTGLLAFFEIRHFTNGGDVFNAGFGHVEAGLMTLVALGLSYAMARMHFAKSNPVFDIASMVFGILSVTLAFFGLAVSANPLMTGDAVGGRTIFSSLLPAYLVPGLAALYVARNARDYRPDWYLRAAGMMAVALIAMYVTLEVRHAFQGPDISLYLETSGAEQWAHSFAWLVLGIVFLGYGLMRGSLEARMASAALIVLAALKITLFDLAGIGGLWRALSFLCLGAVLIGIGLVYQKIVFAGDEKVDGAT